MRLTSKENKALISAYKLINKETLSTYSDDIELIFIELTKFTKTRQECQGIQDDWLFFLKNAGDLTMIPKDLPELVQSAYEVSNEAGMSKEELELQHKKQEWISIQMSALSQAEKKGEIKGEIKGKVKGVELVAINLLRSGLMSNEKVAEMTGLTIEQVIALKTKLDDEE